MHDLSMDSVIFANVSLGINYSIGKFVILGEPPRDLKEGELETRIGDNAIIRSHTIIYAGNIIGNYFQTGHGVMIREENKIGDNVSIGTGSVVEHHVKIADNVRLHSNVFVPEFSQLETGCWLGPNVVLTNAKYPMSSNVKKELRGVIIRRNAKIGANATLLPGIEVGENSLVGAGSVVTADVPPNKVVAGNPARIIKDISETPYQSEGGVYGDSVR